jgi:AcrR family transcriptional regulator
MPKKQKREPLSQQRIVTAALELIDAAGLEAFTTRALGKRLGCEAMAIYNHFASKEELLDAVADRLMEQTEMPMEGSWRDRARGLANAYRALARVHPHAFPLLATRRGTLPSAYEMYDRVFAATLGQGLDPFAVACMFRALAQYCTGTALYEINTTAFYAAGGAAKIPSDLGTHYPSLGKVAAFFTPAHFDDLFHFGLESMLDGFERQILKRLSGDA